MTIAALSGSHSSRHSTRRSKAGSSRRSRRSRRNRTDRRSRRPDSRSRSHTRGNSRRPDSNKSKPAATTPRQSAHRWRMRRAPIPNPSEPPPVSSCLQPLRRPAERQSTLVSWLSSLVLHFVRAAPCKPCASTGRKSSSFWFVRHWTKRMARGIWSVMAVDLTGDWRRLDEQAAARAGQEAAPSKRPRQQARPQCLLDPMERIAQILFDLMVAAATTSSLPPGARRISRTTPIPQEYNTGRIRMTSHELESVALTLVAKGKGILAADETVPTLTKRFNTLGIQSTEQSRRTYREMLFTSPGAAEFISGVIMYDETIRQKSSGGAPLAEALTVQGILPGIKVDTGAKSLAGSPDETVTEGLDGLRDRLSEYRTMGAHFAKWRAVIHVTDALPSSACVSANAHALARYASLCQEQKLVPIVEPEVLMEGSHTIERCEEVTGIVLHAVFNALFDQGVKLEGMLLKPNMVVAGKACKRQPAVEEVATVTLRCLRRHVPAAVPGIVFLSGGQTARLATAHLNAINQLSGPKPWKISFSYGRALQDPALEAWHGRVENLAAGQSALYHRASCNGAASVGKYTDDMELQSVSADDSPHRRDWRDD